MGLLVVIVQHAEKVKAGGDPGLTERGHLQAARTAERLGSDRWDALCCSPMRRARETAAPIAEITSLEPILDERLRERMNWRGPETESIEAFLADWERATRERDWQPPSGDSSAAAGRRFAAFFESLPSPTQPDARVLAVAHGGVTVDLLRTVFGDDVIARLAPQAMLEGVPSCGLTRLEHDGSRWELVSFGSTAHLDSVE